MSSERLQDNLSSGLNLKKQFSNIYLTYWVYKVYYCPIGKLQKHIRIDAFSKILFDPMCVLLEPFWYIYDDKNLKLNYLMP